MANKKCKKCEESRKREQETWLRSIRNFDDVNRIWKLIYHSGVYDYGDMGCHSVMDSNVENRQAGKPDHYTEGKLYANVFIGNPTEQHREGIVKSYRILDEIKRLVHEVIRLRKEQ